MKKNNHQKKLNLIFGKNPINEALGADVSIIKIWIADSKNPKLKEIETKARSKKIPVFKVNRKNLDEITGNEDHRSVAAEISPVELLEESYLLEESVKKVLILANIEDPHNLGAIMRTANAFGVDALVIPNRKSAPISQTTISASAGAVFQLPIVRIGNVTNTIEKLKQAGFWVYGTNLDKTKSQALDKIKFDSKSVLIMGNEGKGMSDKLLKHCDFQIYIPMKFESLNVSVATGIILNKLYLDSITK